MDALSVIGIAGVIPSVGGISIEVEESISIEAMESSGQSLIPGHLSFFRPRRGAVKNVQLQSE
jgi:hypothetical protein